MIWYIVLLPFLFLFFIEYEARKDFKEISKDVDNLKGKWHRQSAVKTFLVIVALCVPLFFVHLIQGLYGVFLLCSLFWFFFDMRLNMLRNKDWDYVGYTAGIDKAYRSRFKKPEQVMILTKVLLIIAFIHLYYSYNA